MEHNWNLDVQGGEPALKNFIRQLRALDEKGKYDLLNNGTKGFLCLFIDYLKIPVKKVLNKKLMIKKIIQNFK